MRKILLLSVIMLVTNMAGIAQDGKIISKEPYVLGDEVYQLTNRIDTALTNRIKQVDFSRMVYLSDGLKVVAYLAEPKNKGKHPCIISNRGGNRDFGKWESRNIGIHLGVMASWGYTVIASQYRGVEGGEGQEEFGGKEINDVLNLVHVLSQIPNADTSRIGLEGGSRGGMMTYLAMKKSCRFKAAVVSAGVANSFSIIKSRPEMETSVYAQLIPNYQLQKEQELKARSAVFWADQLCKTTPLLIMHGSSDWRVPASESLELVQKLYEYKHPTRFILFEGADHGLTEFIAQSYDETKRHFDDYLRDGKKLPNMERHGN